MSYTPCELCGSPLVDRAGSACTDTTCTNYHRNREGTGQARVTHAKLAVGLPRPHVKRAFKGVR